MFSIACDDSVIASSNLPDRQFQQSNRGSVTTSGDQPRRLDAQYESPIGGVVGTAYVEAAAVFLTGERDGVLDRFRIQPLAIPALVGRELDVAKAVAWRCRAITG